MRHSPSAPMPRSGAGATFKRPQAALPKKAACKSIFLIGNIAASFRIGNAPDMQGAYDSSRRAMIRRCLCRTVVPTSLLALTSSCVSRLARSMPHIPTLPNLTSSCTLRLMTILRARRQALPRAAALWHQIMPPHRFTRFPKRLLQRPPWSSIPRAHPQRAPIRSGSAAPSPGAAYTFTMGAKPFMSFLTWPVFSNLTSIMSPAAAITVPVPKVL